MTVKDVYENIRMLLPKEIINKCTYHIRESHKIEKFFNTSDKPQVTSEISVFYHLEDQFSKQICYCRLNDGYVYQCFDRCKDKIKKFTKDYYDGKFDEAING